MANRNLIHSINIADLEADLDLDSVPVAYRDYLRRYFNAIRPQETSPAEETETAPAP